MRFCPPVILAAAFVALSSSLASAQEIDLAVSEPTPADVGTEPTWLLVGVGSALFLGEYLGEVVMTAATGGSSAELERAAIPVAGPWLELASGAELEWWEVALTARPHHKVPGRPGSWWCLGTCRAPGHYVVEEGGGRPFAVVEQPEDRDRGLGWPVPTPVASRDATRSRAARLPSRAGARTVRA